MQVGQYQKQVQTGEDDRHQRPEKEPVDLRCRVVHGGEEAARNCREDYRTGAVVPAQSDPQAAGDHDRQDRGGYRVQHQATIEKRCQAAQPPVAIHRTPRLGIIGTQGMLQGAAVLPQVGPFGQAVQGVGQQQLGALVEGGCSGLQAADLLVQRSPVRYRSAVGSAFEPFTSRFKHGLKLGELGRGAAFQGHQGVVERVDYRQQVNHPPAQLTGILQGMGAGAFVA
ncbi:hypothetical protein D3C80_1348670 [compost metagenome]